MQIIIFKDLAQKQACSEEEAMCKLEAESCSGETVLVMSPDRAEAISLDAKEVQDLMAELACGKISLDNLAEELKLSTYQVHYVVEYFLNACLLDGELTYNTFTASSSIKLSSLEKAKAHKHEHRRKMQKKG